MKLLKTDARVAETLAAICHHLDRERAAPSHWAGELSSSALSTATAVFALKLCERHPELQSAGLDWLAANQNSDGGWGDTVKSISNISTTALCWAAIAGANTTAEVKAAEWLRQSTGSLDPAILAKAIADRYGRDRTFSVPILTMLALAGRLGPDPWQFVPQLPFELAALPFAWFRTIRLPVVSYALPALIAIGTVRHRLRPTWNPAARALRVAASGRAMRTLKAIQPTTGGYLEATPLTSFVVMSLAGAGLADSPVVRDAIPFLVRSMRPDGSWPIDTNLATWATTLTVNALGGELPDGGAVRRWLLDQQYRNTHVYTQSPPGGWAWTNLSGGVPDGDDTPGSLLALRQLGEADAESRAAAELGCRWLFGLQNRDGGIPTFCRGWGALPFDRSSTDLTAHALLAWHAWREELPQMMAEIDARTSRALGYLAKVQRPDGAWEPLWFGNQHAAEVANLTYGTGRVLRLAVLDLPEAFRDRLRRGADYLLSTQLPNGGWGGRAGTLASVEETGVALEGLCALPGMPREALERAAQFLADATRGGTEFDPEPIGFYFANLWYFEKLYPPIFAAAGLRAYLSCHS